MQTPMALVESPVGNAVKDDDDSDSELVAPDHGAKNTEDWSRETLKIRQD